MHDIFSGPVNIFSVISLNKKRIQGIKVYTCSYKVTLSLKNCQFIQKVVILLIQEADAQRSLALEILTNHETYTKLFNQ